MSSEWERDTPTIYIGSLLSQELHPVPIKPLGNPLSNQTRLQHTNHQSIDLEPFKKHTTFDKTYQEYWSWPPQEHITLIGNTTPGIQ